MRIYTGVGEDETVLARLLALEHAQHAPVDSDPVDRPAPPSSAPAPEPQEA